MPANTIDHASMPASRLAKLLLTTKPISEGALKAQKSARH